MNRRFFTKPGDSLLLSHDPIEAAIRTQRVIHTLGLDISDVVVSPLTRLPIPMNSGVLPRDGKPSSRPRPRDTNATSMWLPFWWLPSSASSRLELDNGQPENINTMAVRLALELEASNLYDPLTGLWVDVLEPLGIDTTDQDGIDRVEMWLEGGFDAVLNKLNDERIAVSSHGRSMLDSALWLQSRLYPVVWHDGADSLMETLDEILPSGEFDALEPIVDAASVWFRGCDEWSDDPFEESLEGALALRSRLQHVVEKYEGANENLVDALLT